MPRRPKRLTDSELELMHVVWDAGDGLTVRDVADALRRPRSYTTVQTLLNILCRKGALRSRPGEGRALVYEARVSRDDATSSMTTDFVERLFGGRAEHLFAQLLTDDRLGRAELEDLKRAIEDQLDDSPAARRRKR